MDLKYRYPGIKPFLTEEQNLFFGRDLEIKKVLELIDLEKNLVIFSKSGIGKSSLINAGIIPQFETNYKHYKYVNIRFGTYFDNNQQSPVQKIIEGVQKKFDVKPLDKIINLQSENLSNTLWANIKSLQLENSNNTFVLIFDQFEELFSYPESEINLFKNQLYELLYTKIPQTFKNALNELISENQDIISHETLNILETLPKVKLIFSIRSDRMSFLNQLKDVIPSILLNAYEIKALSNEHAVKCITEPAKLEGNFVSEKFDYEPKALAKIIDYLSNNKNKPIETFQLQIICQHIENKVIDNKISEINVEHIQNIENIFNDYYLSILNKIPDNEARTKAQILIEEKLIIEERRISLDEIICKKEVSESALQILADSRLLRRMPTSLGGFSYEISHDTLINPILEQKKKRNTEETIKEEKYKKNFVLTIKYLLGLFSIFVSIALMYILGIKLISLTFVYIVLPASAFVLYKIYQINKEKNIISNIKYSAVYINLFLVLFLYITEIQFSAKLYFFIQIVFYLSLILTIFTLIYLFYCIFKEKSSKLKFNDLTFIIVFFAMIFLNISNFSKISVNTFSNQIFMIKKTEIENKRIKEVNILTYSKLELKSSNINKLQNLSENLNYHLDSIILKLLSNYNLDSVDYKTHYFYKYESFVQDIFFEQNKSHILIDELNEYNSLIQKINKSSNSNFIVETSKVLKVDNQKYDLIKINFGLTPLITAILNLRLLQKDILMVENNCLNNFKYQILEQKFYKLDSIKILK